MGKYMFLKICLKRKGANEVAKKLGEQDLGEERNQESIPDIQGRSEGVLLAYSSDSLHRN